MRALLVFCGLALTLAFMTLTTQPTNVQAQTDHPKHQPLLDGDAPWGLLIAFAPGTTLQQANQLRIRYELELTPQAYRLSDTETFTFLYPDEAEHYQRFMMAQYAVGAHRGCWQDDSCPPITPYSARYEPVTDEIANALLNEPIVAALDNRNNRVFFWIAVLRAIPEVLSHWTMTAPTGPAASS